MKSSFLTKAKKLFEPVDLTKGKPYNLTLELFTKKSWLNIQQFNYFVLF